MRTSVLIIPLIVSAIAVLLARAETGSRSERSIREWFSSFMKRFQRKESRTEPFYLRPAHPSYFQSPSFDDNTDNQYDQYQPTSYSHQNNLRSGFDGGFDGGHVEHGGHGGHGGHEGHKTGFSGGISSHFTTDVGHGATHHVKSHAVEHRDDDIPKGFGPLKNSDVIGYAGDTTISHQVGHSLKSSTLLPSAVDSFEVPSPSQNKLFDSSAFHQIDNGPSYDSPSNSIIASTPTKYIPKSKEEDVPLDLHSSGPLYQELSASNTYPTQSTFYLPSESASQIIASGKPGESFFAPQLGPDDPIIEIVFQDGEPAPPLPPPVIDESLYAPASDDVEVYFIEYSPEDNLDDIKNLDLSGAQPAILQNLPTELPHELRDHLVNSGVLNNAQIEILDLDKALTDQSLDVSTRNALRQAYTRTNRQAPSNTIVDKNTTKRQAVDVRVQRLNHDSSTPEGIVEFLSGLKPYRKGTYAGVVEVNDKQTDKYIPVSIDGGKLPLPETIPLENKKVEGVLVFADKKAREPKATFVEKKPIQASSTPVEATIVPPNQRRMIDIQWADMDSNGWIPIVGS